jgi:Lipase (class 3)
MSIPYDASKKALFRPGEASDFFTHDVSSTNAGLCAEMARLAYVKAEIDARAFLARAQFSLVAFVDIEGSQALVATRGDDVVVAFRGTEADDPTDLGSDVDLLRVRWPTGGHVHRGFKRALDHVWPALEAAIPAQSRLMMTGHSLGAALATLAATRRQPAQLFTFGSPRVGDREFAASGAVTRVPHARYVDCADLVTRVPPEALGYAHTGTRHYIDRHGKEQPTITDAEIQADRVVAEIEYLREFAFKTGTAPTRSLADHAPINYLSGVAGLRA